MPVSSSKTPSKMDTIHRLKQNKHLEDSENLKLKHQIPKGLSDSWRMGLLSRPFRRLSPHFHPSKLEKIPMVHPPNPNLPIHLSALHTSDSPTGIHCDNQRSEAYGPLQENQTPPVPGLLAYQDTTLDSRLSKCKGHCEPKSPWGGSSIRKVRGDSDSCSSLSAMNTT